MDNFFPAMPLENPVFENDGSLTARIVVLSGDKLWRSNEGDFVIDLDSLEFHRDRLILDYNHNEEEILGHIDDFIINDGKLLATARIYSIHPGDKAEEVIQRVKKGTPYEISPTVVFGEGEREEIPEGMEMPINGRRVNGGATIFHKVPVRGVSICPYGTDRKTGFVGLSLERPEQPDERSEEMTEEKKDCLNEEGTDAENKYTACPELEKMIAEFGVDKGVEYFRKGVSFEDAQAEDYAQLKAARLAAEAEQKPPETPDTPQAEPEAPPKKDEELSGLKATLDALKAEMVGLKAQLRRGESVPVSNLPEVPADAHQNKAAASVSPIFDYAKKLSKK